MLGNLQLRNCYLMRFCRFFTQQKVKEQNGVSCVSRPGRGAQEGQPMPIRHFHSSFNQLRRVSPLYAVLPRIKFSTHEIWGHVQTTAKVWPWFDRISPCKERHWRAPSLIFHLSVGTKEMAGDTLREGGCLHAMKKAFARSSHTFILDKTSIDCLNHLACSVLSWQPVQRREQLAIPVPKERKYFSMLHVAALSC